PRPAAPGEVTGNRRQRPAAGFAYLAVPLPLHSTECPRLPACSKPPRPATAAPPTSSRSSTTILQTGRSDMDRNGRAEESLPGRFDSLPHIAERTAGGLYYGGGDNYLGVWLRKADLRRPATLAPTCPICKRCSGLSAPRPATAGKPSRTPSEVRLRGHRMGTSQDPGPEPTFPSELDLVVREVLGEALLQENEVRPEERESLKQHALKKPMGVLHVWALGVGVVITGEYFGWNQGLKEGGPLGMLLASLFVCALYMMWVLALSELSVAMPFAGGPLAYGRRAVGPTFGFVMGWSMFLEALFATIGTALATGGYIYFVLNLFLDGLDAALTTTIAGLATVAVFTLVQWVGSKRQAQLMEWMT